MIKVLFYIGLLIMLLTVIFSENTRKRLNRDIEESKKVHISKKESKNENRYDTKLNGLPNLSPTRVDPILDMLCD